MTRKPAKPAKPARRAKPRARVYTVLPPPPTPRRPLPPRYWAPSPDEVVAWEIANAAISNRLMPPENVIVDRGQYTAWWHETLAAIDAAQIATLQAAVTANNAEVAALAHNLDLGVKSHRASEAIGERHVVAHVVQYDAGEMARRIEAASAQHKRKPRDHKGVSRNLRYVCPTCNRPLRSAGSDRVILCGGTYDAPHEPAVCGFDHESLPDYRKADIAAMAGHTDVEVPETSNSLAKLAEAKARQRQPQPGSAAHTRQAQIHDDVIPF